jgi:cation:H+ antiporter
MESLDFMVFFKLACGLLLLVVGGDGFVRGAVAIAKRLGLSPLLIGLTLVGFGTSTPELLTSVQAALAGSPGIAVGNVVGSNIANILLILGLAALIQPLRTTPAAFRRDGAMVLLAALACVGLALWGEIDRILGMALVAVLVGYVVHTYRQEVRTTDASAEMHAAEAAIVPGPRRLWLALAIAVLGLLATLVGAQLLVDGAIATARGFAVSETVIGLTIVAVGTSLPELVVSLVAAFRREADVAFGNIVGSNIYNALGILGVTALVRPLAVPAEIAAFDIWVMLAATLALLGFALTGWRVTRMEGGALLAAYALYLVVLTGG